MRSRPKIDHPVISKEEGNIFQAKRDPFLLQAKYLVKQKKDTSSLSICKRVVDATLIIRVIFNDVPVIDFTSIG